MEVGRYNHPLPVPDLGVLGLSFIASLKCLIKLFPLHPTSQCPLVKHHCRDVVTPESALRMLPLTESSPYSQVDSPSVCFSTLDLSDTQAFTSPCSMSFCAPLPNTTNITKV